MESLELKDKVNILGTEYSIKGQIGKETPKLEHADGICEFYSKEIVIDDFEPTIALQAPKLQKAFEEAGCL